MFSKACIENRKARAASALEGLFTKEDVLVIFAGEPQQKPGGLDQTYPFIVHPNYYWISGNMRPLGASVYTLSDGWIDFIKPLSLEEKIWESQVEAPEGRPLEELSQFLQQHNKKYFHFLGSVPTVNQGFDFALKGLLRMHEAKAMLMTEAFHEARRSKDDEEVALIRQIAAMAEKGYLKISQFLREGISERDLQIEYEAEVFRAGAERMPYETIIGSGSQSAILHALPSAKRIKKSELVLVDAGADLANYCVDITRVFITDDKPSERQRAMIDIVKRAQEESIAMCTSGTEWHQVHLRSAQVIAEGLQQLGMLKVAPHEAVESGAVGVFFPHGVGHMVGLHVRDVGGRLNTPRKKYAGVGIRVDMPLKNNYLMTVEPGMYFISELINSKKTREKYHQQINFSEAEKWLTQGGVRLEDDILITEKGPQNLTALVPKIDYGD